MADDQHLHAGEKVDAEVKDRGLFDFLGKKKEHQEGEGKSQEEVVAVAEFEKVEGEGKCCQEEVLVTEFEKVQVTEAVEEEEKMEEKKKEGLLEKLHRSHSSSSSSSSDEEEAEEGKGEQKKKKKSLKDKIKEKISGGEKKEGEEEHVEQKVETVAAAVVVEDNTIPVEKIDELASPESEAPEKKSLLDKIKGKLPGAGGQHKKPAEEAAPPAPPAAEPCPDQGKEHHEGDSPKEKKGFLGKIMDKIPGYHKNNGAAEESSTTQ